MANTKNINLIVAVCEGLGIGYKGELPWTLRNEMKYFSAMTRRTSDPGKQNVVIMGRKTWFSIPEKNRPLINRVNIVLSRQQTKIPGADYTCSSLQEAILLMHNERSEKIENLWVIGGYEIFKTVMDSDACHRIYLTRIMKDFECDVFFPNICPEKYHMITDPIVPKEIQVEKEIKYKYEIYEKL